ncbi:MAG: CRISPR-associated endonuclease Cas1 [Saprospiraceae bacterium]
MNLFVDNYGARLEIDNNMLKITRESQIRKFSFLRITSINLLKPASLTTSVLSTAAGYQVPVLIYSETGKVEAWVWSYKYGSIAELRKRQVYFCDSTDALSWMRELMSLKLKHQIQNLKWLKDRVPGQKEFVLKQLPKLEARIAAIKIAENFDRIRGLEGNSSKTYWAVFSIALRKHVVFEGRDKRQPKDEFNKCLNYMYGILYGIVESSLLMTGIDPYIGMMHVIRHDRPVLVYDHIEPFRPWVDRMVSELFMAKRLTTEHFKTEDGLISLEGRRVIIEYFFSEMGMRSVLNGRKIKKIDHIHFLSQVLAQRIRGNNENEIDIL